MKLARPPSAVLVSLAFAMVVAGCSAEPSVGANDESAEIQPALITLQPTTATPGDLVSVYFPDERGRGVHYVLESSQGDRWNLEYHLTSDWAGERQPTSQKATESTFAIESIGFEGPGPDIISIPAEAEPGEYRICTGNSRPNICARLTIEPRR